MKSKPAGWLWGRRNVVMWVASVSALSALAACGGGGYGGGNASMGGSLAPVITAAPAGTTVTAGQPAMFTVMATGYMPMSFQWMRGNVDIQGATQATYTLAAATAADNGATFSAKVTTIYGSVTSSSATLTVQ